MARKAVTISRKSGAVARKGPSGSGSSGGGPKGKGQSGKRPSKKAKPASARPSRKRRGTAKTADHSVIGDRYRLDGTYERLRRALLEAPDDGRLDRALSYWVLPTDRRLPIAFLDRDLRELLELPLEELMGT